MLMQNTTLTWHSYKVNANNQQTQDNKISQSHDMVTTDEKIMIEECYLTHK